eukprot:TRINITY_DN20418_c0_g1_i1.p1 TRINITY_DN20418_c0_g1~~TRINITY_DN20418_c0_g1_i1.p1  ORF type:complete len:316 (-),score=45.74 TRINITY_DN20418_c0_g1_i1:199-1101(-)
MFSVGARSVSHLLWRSGRRHRTLRLFQTIVNSRALEARHPFASNRFAKSSLATDQPAFNGSEGIANSLIADRLADVRLRVEGASVAGRTPPRIVAVSKTKPVEMLLEAYAAGQRHFGENYVQELVQKAPLLPEDVQWHFIGRLQSNKVKTLINACPSLACIETVTSSKLARAVNTAWIDTNSQRRLRVMIQVNSSGELNKGGVEPVDCAALCEVVARECDGLELAGLMTIGAADYSGCRTEDFETLRWCQQEVAKAVGIEADALELSMGMSNDFETAIREGSTSVRIGSTIFGARQYPAT